ncbi:MAG TPA: plasmid partitioning protein RepB C-terminal domain-containing protein [Polyangiaceae bacterium]|nr:plasmid partitioning protein RepB C-terminal domain-containing protein [Polyangiaceae bacterium]
MTASSLKAAFSLEGIVVPLDKLLPTRATGEKLRESTKYRALVSSVREVGIVEPLSVYPQKGGKYLILDGHARVEALRELGVAEAPCLIADQDEGYTYNQKVSRIAPIQANRMILKALDAGVPEERIAKALNLSVNTVRNNRRLLNDICAEAVELLRDKHVAQGTLVLLKKVKPLRQIEMAEIMVAAGTYSATYARALVMTTAKEQLVDPENPKKLPGVKAEDLSRLEHEVRVQEKDFRMLDETYNEHVMALTIARGYLRNLLDNGRVVRFLSQNYREVLAEFQRLVESPGLDA